MASKTLTPVTMRVKIGDAELEVSGPQKFVEEKVDEFVAAQGGRREAGATAVLASEGVPANRASKASTLAQLLKKATVKSDVDRVLVAGYYLETVQNMPSFTAAEIKEAIRQAKVSPPSNPSDVIAKNIKKGAMMMAGDKDGRMAYVLTTDGIEFVEEQLKT
jgi:hypothetical protein